MKELWIAGTLNLENTCRTCLNQSDKMNFLFDLEHNSQKLIVDILMSITELQIVFNDNLPRKVCNECINKIVNSYNFKLQAEHNEKVLLNYLNAPNNLKTLPKSTDIKTDEDEVSENEVLFENEEVMNYLECETLLEQIQEGDERDIFSNFDEETQSRSDLKCKQCNLEFETKVQLTNHSCINFFSIGANVKENTTNKKQSSEYNKENVKKELKSKPKIYACAICGESFAEKSACVAHLSVHKPRKEFACPVCHRQFYREDSMKLHLAFHKKIKQENGKFTSEAKTKVSTKKSNQIFTTIKSEGEKKFECPICNKRFTRKDKIRLHIRKSHEVTEDRLNNDKLFSFLKPIVRGKGGERNFFCPICGKSFANKYASDRHLTTHKSEEEKQFECPICNKRFHRKDKMKAHLKIHDASLSTRKKQKDVKEKTTKEEKYSIVQNCAESEEQSLVDKNYENDENSVVDKNDDNDKRSVVDKNDDNEMHSIVDKYYQSQERSIVNQSNQSEKHSVVDQNNQNNEHSTFDKNDQNK